MDYKHYLTKPIITVLLLVILCLVSSCVTEQSVDCNIYNELGKWNFNMKYSVGNIDTTNYIVVMVESNEMIEFIEEPKIEITTFDDKELTFTGMRIDPLQRYGYHTLGSYIMPEKSSITTGARFKVTAEQFEIIKNGIAKVQLYTTRYNRIICFKKDKLGKEIYRLYQHIIKKQHKK